MMAQFDPAQLKILRSLFVSIEEVAEFEAALFEQCAIAYLHGLTDKAFESGKFALADYHAAKKAIANLGTDIFASEYFERFGKYPPAYNHLPQNDVEQS